MSGIGRSFSKLDNTEYLEYDDIWLVPNKISSISSRDEIDTSSYLGNIKVGIPLIAAPMVDVVDSISANTIIKSGAYAILHRFGSIEDQVADYLESPINVSCSVGLEEEDRLEALMESDCRNFCLDVANAASERVVDYIRSLATKNINLIVGNIGHVENYIRIAELPNVVGIRLGIGPGSACETKNATGVYTSMVSLLDSIQQYGRIDGVALIADGGIKKPADLCKAIALGADFAMCGGILAACEDSPAKASKTEDGKVYKIYSGSASKEIQAKYKETPRYIEGATKFLESSTETIEELIRRYGEGLRSSMSYFDSRDISAFQDKSQLCY